MESDVQDPLKLGEFIDELRRNHELFKDLKKETVGIIFKLCEIAIYNNEVVYTKGDRTTPSLLMLYGRVALYSKGAGKFCECSHDETLCEENILLEKPIPR